MKRCYKCKSEDIRRESRDETYTFGDAEITITSDDWQVCAACGEAVISGPDLQKVEQAVAQQLARSSNISGASLKWLRSVGLGLKAKELAEVLDVSAETVSRWENDAAPVDRATWMLVAEIVKQSPEARAATVERLRAWPKRPAGPEKMRGHA